MTETPRPRDYAFAPGTSDYDIKMQALFLNRANTTLIGGFGIIHLEGFFKHLAETIPKPVGDLLIASHGNDRGFMQIDLDSGSGTHITYEALEQAVTKGSIRIPDALIQKTGQPASSTVRIRGCRIGREEPFMKKLKEALGGAVGVTAPRHFHFVTVVPALGAFEYLCYASFHITRPTKFDHKDALVAAFQAARFTFIDDSGVPAERWADWIPGNADQARHSVPMTVDFGETIGNRTTGTVSFLNGAVEYRHDVLTSDSPWTIENVTEPPPDDAAGRSLLKSNLKLEATFQGAHDYPVYRRFGHRSTDEYVDNWSWTFTWNRETKRLDCVGTRHEYTILVPITDAKKHLIFNFHPASGTRLPVVAKLTEADDRLFLTV
jgi:hypothetical protein